MVKRKNIWIGRKKYDSEKQHIGITGGGFLSICSLAFIIHSLINIINFREGLDFLFLILGILGLWKGSKILKKNRYVKLSKGRKSFALKQTFLMGIIFLSIFLATLFGNFINNYVLYYGGGLYSFPTFLDIPFFQSLNQIETALHVSFYFIIFIYLWYNLLTIINYLSLLKYNYHYTFLATFLFMLMPYNLESILANYISLFIYPSEGAIGYYIVIFPMLLALKATILMFGLTWLFKKFERKKKRK
jgi:hypothetical protein